jgi:hypothetical protein
MPDPYAPGAPLFEVIARFMAGARRWAEAQQSYVGAATEYATVMRDFADVLEADEAAAEWTYAATPQSLRQAADNLDRLTAEDRERYLEAAAQADMARKFMDRG